MADLAVWQRTIVDEEGNVIPGAEIEVRREEDDSLATLYADRAGETPLANPLAADMSGFVRFFAQGDAYTITAVGAGSTRTWRFDPTGRLKEFDRVSEALVADDAADLLPARANLGTFSSAEDVETSVVPAVLDSISVGRWRYNSVLTEPSHEGKVQDASGRWFELEFTGSIEAEAFGVVADGSDMTARLQAAERFVGSKGGGRILLPAGTIGVTSIELGNGSSSSASSYNNVELIGRGSAAYTGADATTLLYVGDLDDDNVMVSIEGRCSGMGVSGIFLDGADKSGGLLCVKSNVGGKFANLEGRRYRKIGIELTVQYPFPSSTWWCTTNIVERCFVFASDVPGARAWALDGKYVEGVGAADTHRNTFISCMGASRLTTRRDVQIPCTLYLGYTDSNTFMECDFQAQSGGINQYVPYRSSLMEMNGSGINDGRIFAVNYFRDDPGDSPRNISDRRLYQYDASSTETEDQVNVLSPADGQGRERKSVA